MCIEICILTRTSNCPNYFKKIRNEVITSVRKLETEIVLNKLKVSHIISVDNKNTEEYVKTICENDTYKYIENHIVDVSTCNQRTGKFYNFYITQLVNFCRKELTKEPIRYYFVVDDDATIYEKFFSSIYQIIVENRSKLVVWKCKFSNKIIPSIHSEFRLMNSDKQRELELVHGDIDSLNYCVEDSIFTEWETGTDMDHFTLVRSILKINKGERWFIDDTLAHINKNGARRGNRKDI